MSSGAIGRAVVWLAASAWVVVAMAGCGGPVAVSDSAAGITLIERSTGKGDVALPYSKYRLANGLTVILHADDSDPLVHVDVTYHVGSAREQSGQSGFAHFFEHMMFQGSANVADEEHFRLITEAGGTLNGSTSSDRTNYYQTVPANYLETVLWLESDRMGYLLPAMTEAKFRVQQQTVLNERGQRVDNVPYGRVNETIDAALFGSDHPYGWPTIGWREDIQRYQLADLEAFFKRWYGPNNAVLTIAGDFDEAQALAWVTQYFGPIAAGPAVDKAVKKLHRLDEDRYVTLEDRIHLPMVAVSMPTVVARHADEAPLDLLASVLGDGKSSLLYRNLVATGKAVSVRVSHPCRELACNFTVTAWLNPESGASLGELHAIIRQSLAQAAERGVSADELLKVQNGFEAGLLHQLESVAGKASLLATGEIFAGQPDQTAFDLGRYRAVTAADVSRVFNSYLRGKPAVVISVVKPGLSWQAVRPDNFYTVQLAPVDGLESLLGPEPSGLQLPQPVKASPGRQRPVPTAAVTVDEPLYWQAKLDNGIPLLGITTDESPTVNLLLTLEGGVSSEAVNKDGAATLAARMLQESTQNRSAEAMDIAIARLGSSIDIRVTGRYTEISVFALERHLDQTLTLLRERLFKPAFKADEFNRLKARYRQELLHQQQVPAVRAEQEMLAVLYGHQRAGRPQGGTPQSVAALSLQDVFDYYRSSYSAGVASFTVVGRLSDREWRAKLNQFGQWKRTPVTIYRPDPARFPTDSAGRVRIVNLPGSAQTAIRVVRRALPYDVSGDYFAARLMNYPLGGAFNSRLNLNLREDKGYTYGAKSAFVGGKHSGFFQISTDVADQASFAAATEILRELYRYQREGMTDAEVELMRSAMLQSEALSYESPQAKARFLAEVQRYGLQPGFTRQQAERLRTMSRDELNAIARRWLAPREMTVILVGDGDLLRSQQRAGNPFVLAVDNN